MEESRCKASYELGMSLLQDLWRSPAGDEDGVLAGSAIGGIQEGASEGWVEDRSSRGRRKMADVTHA